MAQPNKSVLLEQIAAAIENKSCKDIPELSNHEARNEHRSRNGKIVEYEKYFSNKLGSESIKKLEQRILALENQNDHLLYFIHYLYSNFPHLVKDIVLNGDNDFYKIPPVNTTKDPCNSAKQSQPVVTRREKEILQLLVEGLCAKQIATMLFISETTVITHKKNLKIKFNSKNTVELVVKASAFLGNATL